MNLSQIILQYIKNLKSIFIVISNYFEIHLSHYEIFKLLSHYIVLLCKYVTWSRQCIKNNKLQWQLSMSFQMHWSRRMMLVLHISAESVKRLQHICILDALRGPETRTPLCLTRRLLGMSDSFLKHTSRTISIRLTLF